MTIGTDDYAQLASDAYKTHSINRSVTLGGVSYIVVAEVHNQITGYQGTAYVRADTGEVVIAHCGTDAERMKYQDFGTDAGMVLTGVNAQTSDAMAFTREAIEAGKIYDQRHGKSFHASITGHSLGGTLAEIIAARFNLRGETFNAFGAAGLMQDIPEGGHQVINHVRATDVVSAASRHFGEVHIYASPQDLDTLSKAGYRDGMGSLDARNPVKGSDFDAHGCNNFTPDNPRLGHSIITPENEARYRAHQGMIDRYRTDVLGARTVVSASWEIPKAIGESSVTMGSAAGEKIVQGVHATEHAAHVVAIETSHAYDATRDKVVQGTHAAEHAILQGVQATEHMAHQAYDTTRDTAAQSAHSIGHATRQAATGASHTLHAAGTAVSQEVSRAYDTLSHPSTWLNSKPGAPHHLDHATHPDHALYQQARSAVHHLDTKQGRTPDQLSDNLAASLTVAARRNGLSQIHHVLLSDDAARTFAVQGDLKSLHKQFTHVSTHEAINTPIATSSAALAQLLHRDHASAPQPAPQQPTPHHTLMGR